MLSMSTDNPNLPRPDRSLPIALIRAREAIMPPIRDMLSESGITEQQWRVLRVLAQMGPMDATEVSEHASLLLPSLTRIVRTLTDRGFIARTPDPNDKRRQTLTITKGGLDLIAQNRPEAAQIVDRYRAHLSPDEYEHLLDLLGRLTNFSYKPGK